MVSPLRRLAVPGYLLAGALVLSLPADVLPSVWPLRPAWASWRYAAVGIFSGAVIKLALGLLLASAVATAERRDRILRYLAWAHWACGTATALVALGFVIDAAHAGSTTTSKVPLSYHLGTIMIAAKCLAAAALFIVAGIASHGAAEDIESTSSPGHSAATLAGGGSGSRRRH